jgi:hypothetical protein
MKRYIVILTAILVLFSTFILTSCYKEADPPAPASGSPNPSKITPEKAAANALITLTGSGLGDVRSIIFEKENVPAGINPTLNTDGALIFRVPTDAVPGPQKIILKNGAGVEFKVDFNVLGFATITDVSNFNFSSGSEITLTGKNLDDVVKVTLQGTTTQATVKSKNATSLVLTMPTSDLTQAKLAIENGAGVSVTTQEFVNLDKAFKLFTDDYAPGYQNASWGPAGVSTTESKTGTSSFFMTFPKGNWWQGGFGWTNTANDNFKFLSFWIKGGAETHDLYIWSQQSPAGFGTFENYNKITVPANVWTYFKIPINDLKLWANGSEWNQFGWRIQGPNNQDLTFYVDDVVLIK